MVFFLITVQKTTIQSIPCLVVSPYESWDKPLPTMIYFHGFTSAKEHNLPLAYLLAEHNYRIILPDSLYHGEREADISMGEKQAAFWEIVEQNIKEIAFLRDALQEKNLLLNNRLGIAGTSMGGITTSGALTQYPWIDVAAVLMGTPQLVDYAEFLAKQIQGNQDVPLTEAAIAKVFQTIETYDLSKQMNTLADRPLFFWHGDQDQVIPIEYTAPFYDQAKEYYENKAKIHFFKEKNRVHKVTRPAILETVKWFVKYL